MEAALAEAAAMPWRRRADDRSLRREGRIWTLWSAGIVLTFGLPAALLIWLEPLAAPVSAIFFGHGVAVLHVQARRGARAVKPIEAPDGRNQRRALGLLADLVGNDTRELLAESGLALQRGRLGAWLVGQEGAILIRAGGHRAHCFCVRVGEAGDLPPADRVAHLLLALREDEEGFATVANRNFSGATWRVLLQLPRGARPALREARRMSRTGGRLSRSERRSSRSRRPARPSSSFARD